MAEARAKWEHAKADLDALIAAFKAWSKSNPFSTVGQTDLKTGQQIIRFVILDHPPTDWPIRLGHINADFRSALNYAVNGVATRETTENSFPIFTNGTE